MIDPDGRRMMASAGRASSVGIEMAVSVVGCLLLGYWADGKLGTKPILTIVGLVLGSFAAFWALYKTAIQMQKQAEAEAEKDEKREP